MKTRLFSAFILTGTVLAAAGCCTAPAAPAAAETAIQKELCAQKNIFIPQHIYAVAGEECNIYFKNIFLAVNHESFIFDVNCKAGKQENKRWTFTPDGSHAGKSYPLTVEVYNCREELVARAESTVHVSAADAGKGEKVSILMLGDSLTDAGIYPAHLHRLCRSSKAPELQMIGSHAGRGKKTVPDGVAIEGYNGWRWTTFMTRYRPEKKSYSGSSKFLFPAAEGGKPEFSMKKYLQKYNNGKTPDIITFQLGVNDVFSSNAKNLDANIRQILTNADKLIALCRKDAPDALIGVGFITGGADQDAFGRRYDCGQTAWGFYRNSFRLNQAMAKHFAAYNDKKVTMIPVNVNLDCENNFPAVRTPVNARNRRRYIKQDNGVHPAGSGYQQMGDSYYAWLKYQISGKKQ